MSTKKELTKRFIKIQKDVLIALKALNDLPDDEYLNLYNTIDPNMIMADVKYHYTKYLHLRRQLAQSWFFVSRHFNKYIGGHIVYLCHRQLDIKLKLVICFSSNFDNNSCIRKVKIGEMPAQAIYKLETKSND